VVVEVAADAKFLSTRSGVLVTAISGACGRSCGFSLVPHDCPDAYQPVRRRLFTGMSTSTVTVNGRPVVIPDHTYLWSPDPLVVVRLSRPSVSTSAAQLEALDATVEFWCPPYGACVRLAAADTPDLLAESDLVVGYVPYEGLSARAVA